VLFVKHLGAADLNAVRILWRTVMINRLNKLLTTAALTAALVVPTLSHADTIEEKPTALAMAGDLVIARPILLGITVIGSALYVVSLPFTLAGGNSDEAAQTLVVGPAEATFVRCLGCTKSGRKQKVDVAGN